MPFSRSIPDTWFTPYTAGLFCKLCAWFVSSCELLLGGLQVVLFADLVEEFELGFQPVDVFFFGFQDLVEQAAADKILVRLAVGDGGL